MLPFDPLNLTFHHLNYYVPLTKVCKVAPQQCVPTSATFKCSWGSTAGTRAAVVLKCMHTCCQQEVAQAEGKKSNSRIGQHDGKDMLQLLRDCSGAFRPGILTALVGSSGAGKTTLMDVLAGRKTSEPSFTTPHECYEFQMSKRKLSIPDH